MCVNDLMDTEFTPSTSYRKLTGYVNFCHAQAGVSEIVEALLASLAARTIKQGFSRASKERRRAFSPLYWISSYKRMMRTTGK